MATMCNITKGKNNFALENNQNVETHNRDPKTLEIPKEVNKI